VEGKSIHTSVVPDDAFSFFPWDEGLTIGLSSVSHLNWFSNRGDLGGCESLMRSLASQRLGNLPTLNLQERPCKPSCKLNTFNVFHVSFQKFLH